MKNQGLKEKQNNGKKGIRIWIFRACALIPADANPNASAFDPWARW